MRNGKLITCKKVKTLIQRASRVYSWFEGTQMALHSLETNGILYETDDATPDFGLSKTPINQADNQPRKLLWLNIFISIFYHLTAIYGAYLLLSAKWQTLVFVFILYVASILGITAGVHRLWSHKSYKTKWPLRFMLVVFNTLAYQNSVIDWARDHRMHHKYTDTDADPHNAARGFFYSHIGWLFLSKHPEYEKKINSIDISDLEDDPMLRFQHNHYVPMMVIISFILPLWICVYFWNESLLHAYLVGVAFRQMCSLQAIFCVNSVSHKWGKKPYDANILSTENLFVNVLTLGEGFHNYHHAFPWDYRASELSNNRHNFATLFIDFFAKIGWAYDLKTVSQEIILKRINRTGDGSHPQGRWEEGDHASKKNIEAVIRKKEKICTN